MKPTNEMIAEKIMGWRKDAIQWFDGDGNQVGFSHKKHTAFFAHPLFDPLHDMNHCRLAEKRMEELGLESEYSHALVYLVVQQTNKWDFFSIITASPAQRCETMLKAKGVEDE